MSLSLTPAGRGGLQLAGRPPAAPDAGDRGPTPRCHWDDDVCDATPEHFVVWPGYAEDDPPEAETYCAQHYVVTLARLLELHLPTCPGRTTAHILRWGRLDESD